MPIHKPKELFGRKTATGFKIMKSRIMKRSKSGFSLLELCVVMAIMLIVAALAAPSIRRTMDGNRLRSSANAMKDMLQQAQAAARKANEPYYAQPNPIPDPANPMQASAQSASGAGSTPTAETSGNVTLQRVGPGNINTLINALDGIAPAPQGTPIGFNARGVPCVATVNPYVCPGPTAFIWFLRERGGGGWAAVTVTAAGRIRSWRYIPTNGTWD